MSVGSIVLRADPVKRWEQYSRTLVPLGSPGPAEMYFSDFRVEYHAEGGMWSTSLKVYARETLLKELFANALGRFVEAWGYGLQQYFEGRVTEVVFNLPPDKFTKSIDTMVNKVWMRADINADGTVDRSTTLENAGSQARFGISDLVISGGQIQGLVVADQAVQAFLDLRAFPKPSADLGGGSGTPHVELFCRGIISTLAKRVYNQTANTGSQSMSSEFKDIIGTQPAFCTGGTLVESGGKRIHTFTSSGTLTVIRPGNLEVLIVAGGGGGGGGAGAANGGGGGGGAGGLLYRAEFAATTGVKTVTIGAGGTGGNGADGTNGENSIFDSLTAIGGGGGGYGNGGTPNNGGSGGGCQGSGSAQTPGTGTAGQGNVGGANATPSPYPGGGGGGAGAPGGAGSGSAGGAGGAGAAYSISGASVTYAGGGGAANNNFGASAGAGGAGGGGAGGTDGPGTAGTANRGGGGGGGSDVNQLGGDGASGIVIISYAAIGGTGEFIASTRRDANTTPVTKEYDADRKALDILTNMAALGDSDNNRWLIQGVGKSCTSVKGRRLVLKQAAPVTKPA